MHLILLLVDLEGSARSHQRSQDVGPCAEQEEEGDEGEPERRWLFCQDPHQDQRDEDERIDFVAVKPAESSNQKWDGRHPGGTADDKSSCPGAFAPEKHQQDEQEQRHGRAFEMLEVLNDVLADARQQTHDGRGAGLIGATFHKDGGWQDGQTFGFEEKAEANQGYYATSEHDSCFSALL